MGKVEQDVEIVDWEGPNDPRNPVNWPSYKKWIVMTMASLVLFAVELNATSIASASTEISDQFDISDASFPNSYWPITSWTFAGAIAPVILAPLIEDYGTRPGFLITYILFAIFVIPQAVAQNFATLIVTRAICGGCGATIAALVDGVAADMWVEEGARGKAMIMYTLALLGGFTVGPVVGGGIIGSLGWRWIFYIQIIIYFSLLPFLYLILRETRGPVILTQVARHMRKQQQKDLAMDGHEKVYYSRTEIASQKSSSSTLKELKLAVMRPTQLLFTEPVLASFTLWSAFTLGMVFTFTQSIPQVYQGLYDWDDYSTGVVQIAVFIGQILGSGACWLANGYYMRSKTINGLDQQHDNYSRNSDSIDNTKDHENRDTTSKKGTSKPVPLEARLYLAIPATILGLSGGFFWYAWSSYSYLHWIMPTIGLGLAGFGMMCIVTAVDIYITDSYDRYAGSAIAAVTFGENTISAFLPLATSTMYNNLGYNWASSLLAFISLALCLAPVVLVWKGASIRKRSRFMHAGEEGEEAHVNERIDDVDADARDNSAGASSVTLQQCSSNG